MRAIDADALKESIKRALGDASFPHLMAVIVGQIDKAPTIQSDAPRVMTLEEARNVEVVWAEDRSTRKVYPYIVKDNMNDSKLYKYGVQWRCWTARPTDEQREAVKWDG